MVMQSLKSTPMAHEAEEDPAMDQSTTEIRIVPLAPSQDVLTDLCRSIAEEQGAIALADRARRDIGQLASVAMR